MNSMFGSPDLARLVAQQTIKERIADAERRSTSRRARPRVAQPPPGAPRRYWDFLARPVHPAH